MRAVDEIFASKEMPISFEIFPPKGELTVQAARSVAGGLAPLSPDFVSVTCSAAGVGDKRSTDAVASMVQEEFGIPSVAHVTCASQTGKTLDQTIEVLKRVGIRTVLALRGDLPADPRSEKRPDPLFFHLAIDMMPRLKNAGFCVGAAAYPEGHVNCFSTKSNIDHLLAKQDAGADYFVTQLCFDNDAIYRFLDEAKSAGIRVPITIGIMPFMSKSQLTRMVFMCGASLPSRVVKILGNYENDPESLRMAGIEYACHQLEDLSAHGVDGLHIYTMNDAGIAEATIKAIRNVSI